MTPIQNLLARLNGVRNTKSGWEARCPCEGHNHGDREPSLSVSEGTDGKVLLHCHAGHNADDICRALGLELRHLFASNGSSTHNSKPKQSKPKRVFATANEAKQWIEQQLGPCSAHWGYHSADGQPVGLVLRWDKSDGSKVIRPISRVGESWEVAGMPEPRPLYQLPELLSSDGPVWIVEGEKCADALRILGLNATTSPHGSGSAAQADWSPLAGRDVYLSPDNDQPGSDYVNTVADILANLTPRPTVRIVLLLDLPAAGDVVDHITSHRAAGRTDEDIKAGLLSAAGRAGQVDTQQPEVKSGPDHGEPDNDETVHKKSQSTLLVELARDAEFWHTPSQGDAYATIQVDDHHEHWPIRSRTFKRWLCRQFYVFFRKTPGSQSVQDALGVLEGEAIFAGQTHNAAVRVAERDSRVYLDLADQKWRAIEIDCDGWRVVTDCPVRFRRAKAVMHLPVPQIGGKLLDLRRFVNVTDDAWPLLLAWLVAALRPTGPYPVLALHGEQGSAKTTVARVLRALIDPNTAPVRCEPREPRDLAIAANNGWIVAFDNLSHLPTWLSDALCRLATGGGFATRTLYENDEESIFEAMRPSILTGIEEVASRSDLLDRCLVVQLPRILDDMRRPESRFWTEFEAARPGILGAALDAVSVAIRNLPTTAIDRLPRMADFALWATAAEPGLGLEPGMFMASYHDNRESAHAQALESCPVTSYVLALGEWTGRASELLKKLDGMASDADKRLNAWPKSAPTLSGMLRRLAPDLRKAAPGVDVTFGREAGGQRPRFIAIRPVRDTCVPIVPIVPGPEEQASDRDDRDGGETERDAKPIEETPVGTTDGTVRDGRDGEMPSCSSLWADDMEGSDDDDIVDF